MSGPEEGGVPPWQYGWTALFAVGPGGVGVGEFIKRLIQSRGNNGLALSLSNDRTEKANCQTQTLVEGELFRVRKGHCKCTANAKC